MLSNEMRALQTLLNMRAAIDQAISETVDFGFEAFNAEMENLQQKSATLFRLWDRTMVHRQPQPQCICPKECDCQNPDAEGVAHVSEHCPIHNVYPRPVEECLAHENS